MKRNHIRVFLQAPFMIMICLLLLSGFVLRGQNAPVTTLATVGDVMSGQVDVPITVTGFNNIGAISLSFDYQYAGLHFVQGLPNTMLDGFAIGDHDLGNGKHRVTMGWFGSGTSLANGEVIMMITFTFQGGITELEFYDNGPSCEYADGNYNVLNDLPQSNYYINGLVCGNIPNPGLITGDPSVCCGQRGVGYGVAPAPNATSYQWTLPAGATIISGANTNTISVDYSLTAVSGNITVHGVNGCGNGSSSQLAVMVNPLPVANAGTDVTIPYGTSTTLHAASGGTGAYSYHWSPESLLVNPNLQNPQTVNLTVTSVFTLTVTNLTTLCNDSDKVVVSISGGPLNANPVSIPTAICRGTSAQLFANAAGGSGNYTYTWSCTPPGSPPWTSSQPSPLVSPDSSKVYHLSLSDGFNTIVRSTSLTVYQLPSATISGGDTLCGEGNFTILTVDLTGTPPWSFYYSNGINTWLISAQYTTPYLINATDAGNYTILAMTDDRCTGTTAGSAIVGVFPTPPVPVISVNGTELFSSGCCGNQWYKNGIMIPGATQQVYEPQVTAHYYDIVTVNGCKSDTSNEIYYFMTGVGKLNKAGYTVQPIPARDYLHVKSSESSRYISRIDIYSISGTIEGSLCYCPPVSPDELLVDIQHLSPGMYFLSVISNSGKTVLKFIVQ